MTFRTVRQQLNIAKPELWLVPGSNYYGWAFLIALMSSVGPLVLLCNWQTVVTGGWYGILNLGFFAATGIVSLGYVLSRLPALVRSDVRSMSSLQVVRREAHFLAWFTGALAALVVVGFIIRKLLHAFV